MSGVKGYFTTVKFKVDSTTDVGGVKELFLAGSEYVMSSYQIKYNGRKCAGYRQTAENK